MLCVVIDVVCDVVIWEWSNKSEVFGNQILSVDLDGDGVVFELVLCFLGQQVMDVSGLFYNYFCDYDLVLVRYVESDFVGLNVGISMYGYVILNFV